MAAKDSTLLGDLHITLGNIPTPVVTQADLELVRTYIANLPDSDTLLAVVGLDSDDALVNG